MIQNEKHYMSVRKQLYDLQRTILVAKRDGAFHNLDIQEHVLTLALKEYDEKHHSDRKGRWMPLFSQNRFWPEDPRPHDIRLIDIAHALAHIPRYNGHLKEHYSVAQHCVIGSQYIDPKYAMFFLFHDAGEAYLGDLITPIKRLFRQFYEPVEERIMKAVASSFEFEINDETRVAVKKMDEQMLETEVRDIVPAGLINHDPVEVPLDDPILHCWGSGLAKNEFIKRFTQLYGREAYAA